MGVCQPQPTNWKCSVFVTKWASIKTIVSHWVNVLDTKISLLARNCIYVMSLGPEDKNNLRHHCILQNKSHFLASKTRMSFTEDIFTVESPWLCLGQCEIPERLLHEEVLKKKAESFRPLHIKLRALVAETSFRLYFSKYTKIILEQICALLRVILIREALTVCPSCLNFHKFCRRVLYFCSSNIFILI